MRKYNFIALVFLFSFSLSVSTSFGFGGISKPQLDARAAYVDAREFTTLTKAKDFAVANNKALYISKNYNITTNTDLSSVPEIHMIKGGSFTVSPDITLTMPLTFYANNYQVFFGSGIVAGMKTASVLWFGAKGDATTDDRASIQKALNSLAAEGTLIIPNTGNSYRVVNATGTGATIVLQRANAVANNTLYAITSSADGRNIQLDGTIQSTSALDDVFRFTGQRIRVYGTGGIVGPQIYLDSNPQPVDATQQWNPTLLRMEGDFNECIGVRFNYPPTVGLWIRGSYSKAINNTFFGGLTAHGAGTVQFYIYSGTDFGYRYGNIITGNHFNGSTIAGATYTGVMNTCIRAIITNNWAEKLLEHGIYNYGEGSLITHNQILNGIADDDLAGAIQSFADNVVISDNIMKNALGISFTGSGIVVQNNKLEGGFIALRTGENHSLSPPSVTYSNTKITGNHILNASSIHSPISVEVSNLVDGIDIIDNNTTGGDPTKPAISLTTTGYSTLWPNGINNVTIKGNRSVGGLYGIYGYNINNVSILGGTIIDTVTNTTAIRTYQSHNIMLRNLKVIDTKTTPTTTTIATIASSDGNSAASVTDCDLTNPASSATSGGLVNTALDGYKRNNSINGIKPNGSFTMPNSISATIYSATRANSRAYALGVVGLWAPIRVSSTAHSLGAVAVWSTTAGSTSTWEITTAGTTASSAPSIAGKIVGDTVTDGTAVWTMRSALGVWKVTTAGTSDVAAPGVTGKIAGDTVTDGTAVWTLQVDTVAVYSPVAAGVLSGNTIILTPTDANAWALQAGANRLYVGSVSLAGQIPIAAAGTIGASAPVYRWEAIQ